MNTFTIWLTQIPKASGFHSKTPKLNFIMIEGWEHMDRELRVEGSSPERASSLLLPSRGFQGSQATKLSRQAPGPTESCCKEEKHLSYDFQYFGVKQFLKANKAIGFSVGYIPNANIMSSYEYLMSLLMTVPRT